MKYDKITTKDLTDAMATGNTLTKAEDKVSNNQGNLWATLCGFLETSLTTDSVRLINMDDIKKVRDELQSLVKVEAQKIAIELGEPLAMNQKGTDVAWTKEPRTKRMMDYCGSIAKVILADDYRDEKGNLHNPLDQLLPGDETVAARCEILKVCKKKEDPIEAVKRLTKALMEVLPIVDHTSKPAYNELFNLMDAVNSSDVWKANN